MSGTNRKATAMASGEAIMQPTAMRKSSIATYIGFLLSRNTPSMTKARVRFRSKGLTDVCALPNSHTAKMARTAPRLANTIASP